MSKDININDALDRLDEMERGTEHSHNKNAAHVTKRLEHAGSAHVGDGTGEVLHKEIIWECEKCGEYIDRRNIRNQGRPG